MVFDGFWGKMTCFTCHLWFGLCISAMILPCEVIDSLLQLRLLYQYLITVFECNLHLTCFRSSRDTLFLHSILYGLSFQVDATHPAWVPANGILLKRSGILSFNLLLLYNQLYKLSSLLFSADFGERFQRIPMKEIRVWKGIIV